MKKELQVTPWFSPDDQPVREGVYDVIEKSALPPLIALSVQDYVEIAGTLRATWETRLGQLGFWVCSKRPMEGQPGATQSIQRLLTIIAWRGVLHPRNKLVPTFAEQVFRKETLASVGLRPVTRRAVLL